MSAADDRDALLSPSRHISVHLPATPSMPGAPLYPDGADLEPDTTAFVKRPGARDGLAGHSQALPGAPPPGADAGAPAADAPAAAREVADAAAGAAVQAPAVRPVDDDYVLSVAADGTTTARPSRKHGGEATLSEGRAGGRAHAGAPRVAFAGPSRQKPSTPLVLHPWEDRAHSESDYSAMLRGIRAKAASQVQEPSHTEATNIRVGSTVSLAGGEAMAVKLFLNPRSPERKSSKSPQKEREEWKEKEWKAWQSKHPAYGMRDYILGDNERAQTEAKETAFRDTIERRAQQARPRNSRQGSRGRSLDVSTALAPQRTTTAFGSKAERNINVHGTLARNRNEMEWVQTGSTNDGPHPQPPPIVLSPTNSDKRSSLTGAPSDGRQMALSAEQGIVRVHENSVELRSYANAVSKRERMRAIGKQSGKKKPIFSPRQISEKIVPDVDFQDFFQRTSYRSKKVESDLQCDSPVLDQSRPQSGMHLWSYGLARDPSLTAKSDDEARRQFARQMLMERSFNERQNAASPRQGASKLNCEVKGQTTVLEERPPGTPLSARKASKQQVVDLHDFLTIEVSPPKHDEANVEIVGAQVFETKLQVDIPLEDARDDTDKATGELGESERNASLAPTAGIQSARPPWRLSRENTEQPRPSRVNEVRERSYRSELPAMPQSPLSPAPPATKKVAFGRAVDPRPTVENEQLRENAAHREPLELHASLVWGLSHSPKQAKHSGATSAGLVDAAILSKAHFTLEYMSASNIVQLQHVDRARRVCLWSGDCSMLEHLVFDLGDQLGVKTHRAFIERNERANPRRAHLKAHESPLDGPIHERPNTSLREWLEALAGVANFKAESCSGSEFEEGDIRSFYFLPHVMLREFVGLKAQLFGPLVKQRKQTSFSDGRCSLLSGKVNNIEYVKGLILRCPANLSTNAANLGTGVKGGLHLASDVTLDLVFGHGAWSKAEQARRSKLAIMKQQSREDVENLPSGRTEAFAEPYNPNVPTTGLEQAVAGEARQPTRTSRRRNRTEKSTVALPCEDIPVKDRIPTKVIKPLPVTEASMKQPVGLPRYMSPRPLGFEEPCQWPTAATLSSGGAYSSARDSLKKGSSCDDRHRTDVNKDDEVEFLVRVRVERSKSPVVGVERRGGAGEPPQVASRSQLSTPFITKLEGRETEGAGDEMEPVPPSTENNGTPSYNRRTLRSCQQLPSRASKREETSIAPTHGSGVNPAESGKLGGLMDLFFPPLNPMEPNNRKLPGENDRWGFGGSSRSATANSATIEAPISMKQMETLPLDVFHSLIQRREADAATAFTPRVVEASKHSGRVLRNPLAPSAREMALAHAKDARDEARQRRERTTSIKWAQNPGYITDRRFRIK